MSILSSDFSFLDTIRFVQLNAHRAQAAAAFLHDQLRDRDQIGLITEPYILIITNV